MQRALKVRIYPNEEQQEFLNAQFGCVRLIYNKALFYLSHQYKFKGVKLNAKRDAKPLLPILKISRRYCFLSQYDSLSLQQACINLDKAFKNFFEKRSKYPKYKSRRGHQSSYHINVKVLENGIVIPKLKSIIKAKIHRTLKGKVSSITLSKNSLGQYFASIAYDDQQPIKQLSKDKPINKIIGIDMGLTHFFTDSSGHKEANPRFLKKALKNLRHKQKKLSRTEKGSKRRAKAMRLVAKAHLRVANARHDFQHKLSRRLVNDNQVIVIETLKVKNMMKNKKLARHIADVSWSSFFNKLDYKAQEQGSLIIKQDQWFASSRLHHCGYKNTTLSLNDRVWDCPRCGEKNIDRDINAAENLKRSGIIHLKAEGYTVSAH